MKGLIISALAALAVLAGVTGGILRSGSLSTNVKTAGMPTMQELHGAAGVDKLPAQDFEDRSLVYPRETKR
jgi:hypothetical protein